jgi:hypothetical protein
MADSKKIKNVMTGMPSEIGYAKGAAWGKIQFFHLNSRKEGKLVIEFKAFVKRFTDSFNGGWNAKQYPNQTVPIAHQVSPRRDLHIEWTVPASGEAEAISNLTKCSAFARMMFPTLKETNQTYSSIAKRQLYYPRSSFIGIKFANLIHGPSDEGYLPGWIRGFNFTPNFEEGVYVSNKLDAPGALQQYITGEGGHLLPSFIDISVDFTPFYLLEDIGYKEGNSNTPWGSNNAKAWPYGLDFTKDQTTDLEGDNSSNAICITDAAEGGWHDVCSRSSLAGARGVTK